jgi:hypothetical protein
MRKIFMQQKTGCGDLTCDFTTAGNGALPGSLYGPTWSILAGKAINNPTATELLTNGNMEIGDPPTNWTAQNATLSAEAVIKPTLGGTQSMKIVSSAANGGAVQTVAMALGDWYILLSSLYGDGINNTASQLQEVGGVFTSYGLVWRVTASWANYVRSGRITAAVGGIIAKLSQVTTVTTGYADNISCKKITPPTLFSTRLFASSCGVVKASWTIGGTNAKCPMGVVMNLDNPYNPQNFVIVDHDNNGNILMSKCVNGTYTNLISTATVYGAGKKVWCRRVPNTNTYQAWYGTAGAEVQIGTDQTITDPSISNNPHPYHGLFDTSPGLNTCTSFSFAAAG